MKAKRSEKLKQIADKESNILKKRLKNKFATAQVSTTSSASKSEKRDLEHCSSLVVDDQSKNNLKRSNSEASSSSVQSKKSKPSSIDENSIPSSETNNVSFKVPEIPIVSKKLRVHAETVSDHDGRKRIAKLKFANMITNTSSQDVAKTLVSTSKVLSYPSISEKPPRKVRWSSQLITIREIPSIGKSLKVNQKKDCPNPISTSRLDPPKPPVQNDFTMDEILTHILSWNTSWLEEQTRVKVSPRVDLNRYKMTHVPPVFDNYKDYCHIFFPLMFHELWQTVYRDYLRQKENPIRQVTEILDVRMCREVSSFSARSLLTSHDRFDSHYIPRGALIKINFFKNSGSKSIVRPCFGFVTSNRLIPNNSSSICDNLLKCYPSSIRDQLTFINDYSVIVLPNVLVNIKKFLQTKLPVVELISIINPSLRLFSAVIDAKKSPLFPSLLRHEDSSSVKAISSSQAYDAPHLNKLNPIQRKIVIDTAETCILSPKPSAFLSLIQGPPGTGKSTVISSLVIQIMSRFNIQGEKKPPKILLVAPSNSAIDSLVKKLRRLAPEMKLIRVGQLNSMDKQVKEIELTRIVNNKLNEMESQLGTNESIQREITHRQEEINHIGHEIEKAISSSKINLLQRKLKDETFKLKRAKKSIQTLSNYEKDKKRQEITRTTLDDADIVATTLSSSLNGQMTSHFLRDKYKPGRNFSICIVDEASQCVEPEGLIPLKLGFSKLVMVGDPEQLPATVSSIKAKDLSYGQSLFNRLFKSSRNSDTNTSIHCLKIQYRMHGDIARWPNHYFYGGELTNGVSWTSRNSDLFPLKLFDLSWTKMEETNNEKSIFNTKEAKFVATLISEIKKEPHIIPGNKTIGVITFYSQQRKHLSLELQNLGIETSDGKRISKSAVTVCTVDGFQGSECDIIVLSCVRSSKQNDIHTSSSIGFTGESERLNVALTRAKYALYIVGDFQTLSKSLMWSDLLKDVRKRKCIVNIGENYDSKTLRSQFLK
ncbi:probable helicase senataxin [Lepeophtheirus salmonis]|uniref:probable helicase senataxin n=1 Tax=Lepeophtheirus salmonis TaxID=72036 RepID=UPI001AE66CB0|nr:helicase SEN1-like [Lepeophtheirus salmonis]